MLILGGNQLAVGYDVDNSLRFDDGSSENLNRTPSTATNRRTFTVSFWVKKTREDGEDKIFGASPSGVNYPTYIMFGDNVNNALTVGKYSGSHDFRLTTTQLFRDPSAWYHIVVAFDTTQAISSNRIKIYVNGNQVTNFQTSDYPSLNYETDINNTSFHQIGIIGGASSGFFDGYLCEFVLIDGQQLAPTSFGEFDVDTGIWKPIAVSGLTFGTNGFYLPFQNSAALGQDDSGNGNNFTVVNLTSNDQMPDTCTNNWCTINPLHEVNATNLAQGNLQYSAPGGNVAQYMGTMGMSKGSWYYEFRPRSGNVDYQIGIAEAPATPPGGNDYQRWTYKSSGSLEFAGGATGGWGSSYGNGDVIGISMDVDNGTFKAYKNGTLSGTKTGLNTDITWLPHFVGYNSPTVDVNFGQDSTFAGATTAGGNTDAAGYGDFKQSVPADHYALNTKNLAEYG